MKELRGSCLCGAIEYTVPDAFAYAGYCHCSECRKFSGAAASAFGGMKASELRLHKGENSLGSYRKSPETELHFCRVCGSSLFAMKPKLGMVHLRLGTLDDPPGLSPQVHLLVASKASWHEITDGLPQFDAKPPVAAEPGV